MFADDTKDFKDISDTEDNKILQNDMQELENWSDKWLLRFHPKAISEDIPYRCSLCNRR
jgi:hypothetical protein